MFGQVNNSGTLYATTKVVDPIGNAVWEANRKGTRVSYKDVDDRIMAVVEYNHGAPITTSYDYDPLGQITLVKDDRGNRTTVEYGLGHLFQNKSIVCEEDSYLLELVRYIHLNPLRARMVEDFAALDRYAWSGHSVIMGKHAMEGQAVDEVLSYFDKGKREAKRQYRLFVADGVALGKRAELGSGRRVSKDHLEELGEEPYDDRVLGSGAFVEELRQMREIGTKFPRAMEIKDIVTKVCRYFEIDPTELQGNSRAARIADVRSVICYLAVRHEGHSGVAVGRHVNLRRAGVSVAAGRGEEKVKNDPALQTLIDK